MSLLCPVQMFWTGRPLGPIERLSIRSWLKHGHPVHLYTYTKDLKTPSGVELLDANTILHESLQYTYQNGSPSAFSNDFRFSLLLKRGGVWVDADVVCVRPMPWLGSADIIIAGELRNKSNEPTTHLLRMPANSMAARLCVELQAKNRKLIESGELKWGAGPKTISVMVSTLHLEHCVLPWWRTSTCPPAAFQSLLGDRSTPYPTTMKTMKPDTDAIHLWHEMWRRKPELTPKPKSLFCELEKML